MIHAYYYPRDEHIDSWVHADCRRKPEPGMPMSFADIEAKKLGDCPRSARCTECGQRIVPHTVFVRVMHTEEGKPVMIVPFDIDAIPSSYSNWSGYLENFYRRKMFILPWDQRVLEMEVIADPLTCSNE